ncbi:MAG TPA: M14 family metallopeptidase [Puia sp.]|nr:M14 family metallopeptidase [Puia sp.]
MQKICALFLGLFLMAMTAFSQNPPSPETFLGYPLGAHFTRHYQIVNYFKEIARTMPGQVKVEQYGETYEGRPLLLAYIASPENFQRLEAIRQNNLRLAGATRDKAAPDENAPAIVWLSYNVHGNEPSSSEAAMKTLYELVNPANAKSKEWLQHAVVIIDPCINPDGRDRYVNWFNTAVGKEPNPDPQSREHQEPWPAGRTNHYNFDLNRDWAWQTQQETQQRMKKYNSWLPQVHVDFHEQGYNNPYYFAPAAEPYHDVITPWQREFQIQIGKNNAKYFDQQGWLYFTKEEFDLFYPSYGDTYPIYSGSIGMTFEQGGIRAGLAVATRDGDTLTLADRLEHHFTTGMSTVEMTAQNATRLIKEFRKYFTDAETHPAGEFKSYFIKADPLGDRLDRLKILLNKNNIEWVSVSQGSFMGLDYETGKTAAFKAAPGDIAINTNQPKSNLLRVLFDRTSRISDSVTYDITAWAVPYVYGLQAYGLGAVVNGIAGNEAAPVSIGTTTGGSGTSSTTGGPNQPTGSEPTQYGYAVRWTGMRSARFLAELLQQGIKTRYSEEAFQSGGNNFGKGTLIITATGNNAAGKNLWTLVSAAARKTGVDLSPIVTGFVEKGADFGSGRVHLIHKPRVGVLTGEEVSSLNAGEVWSFFEQDLGYPITQINADELGRLNWKNYDVLILPNGYYKSLADKTAAEPFRDWVKAGGRLIAMETAVEQLSKIEWGLRQKTPADKKDDDKDKKDDDYSVLHRYGNRQREEVASSVPGSIYKVELDNSHPLAFGYPDYYYTLKQDDNVYEFIKEGGWNVGFIKKDNYVSGFTGVKAKEKLKDGLIFGVQELGRGEIVYMADDPLFRSFWENGKLLFCNAVFLVGQ